MLDARLTAPKVLKMHKVATYTQSKLQDQGIPLRLLPVPLPPQVCSLSPSPQSSIPSFLLRHSLCQRQLPMGHVTASLHTAWTSTVPKLLSLVCSQHNWLFVVFHIDSMPHPKPACVREMSNKQIVVLPLTPTLQYLSPSFEYVSS